MSCIYSYLKKSEPSIDVKQQLNKFLLLWFSFRVYLASVSAYIIISFVVGIIIFICLGEAVFTFPLKSFPFIEFRNEFKEYASATALFSIYGLFPLLIFFTKLRQKNIISMVEEKGHDLIHSNGINLPYSNEIDKSKPIVHKSKGLNSSENKLRELKKLYFQGLITDDEYSERKKALLDDL